jgi:HemX protein
MRFNFFAVSFGFVLQTAFLSIRGRELGRCPITNLFEVIIFVAWSVALFYMVVGPAYRLSLMGAFTAPLVVLLQAFALIALNSRPNLTNQINKLIAEQAAKQGVTVYAFNPPSIPANPWLEFHASMSLVAYGAFALACIAGLMYLVQERQLKTHHLHSIFFHLPPLTDLFAAITRLLWWGFILYTLGLISGFFVGEPLPWPQIICAIGVWILYALILQGRYLHWFAPKRVAALCIVGFSAALTLLWGITFTGQTHTP